MATVECAVNNNIYTATKVSLFIVNYIRELRMGTDIRRKILADKVCKENKESLRRSRSSIGKSIREDEVASRQEKKESSEMEEK